MPEAFPGTGHTYLVNFEAFRVELFLESDTSLTFTSVGPGGSHGERPNLYPIRDGFFPVTWQESDKIHSGSS